MNKDQKLSQRHFSPKIIVVIMLALFFGVALFIRIYFVYDQVFIDEGIRFTSNDAYFQMRLVDNLLHNFPHLINFDPYLLYPSGIRIDNIHFFNWLLAGIIWLIGLGSPTQHTIDTVAVYYPAVLAALMVIPVYFIGKELFSRWVGMLSAGLIIILPGEYMGRSVLGATDYHIAETLFTTTAMMFLILAIKTAHKKGVTLNHLQSRDWTTLQKPIIYSILSGFFLGIYSITWIGALLFVFIITFYLVVQFTIDHLKQQSTDYLVPVGVILFLTALIIYLLFSQTVLYWASLLVASLIPIFLNFVSRFMKSKKIKLVYYPLALVGLGAVGLVIFYFISPSLFQTALQRFSIFSWGGTRTIIEMQPALFPQGTFTLRLVWGNFTTGFFLAVGLLLYLIIYKRIISKQDNAEENILLVWSLLILLATLAQRRFAYYFAVNAALLSGYFSWAALKFTGFAESIAKPAEASDKIKQDKAKLKKRPKKSFRITLMHLNMALGAVIVFFLVFFPNIFPAIVTASQAQYAPDKAWLSSLAWLKENTPEPFADPAAYYQLYEPPPPGEKYQYPESAYGVMSWGDYGYWITRIAHRPANLTPGPGGVYVAKFFLSRSEDSTQEVKWKTKWEEEIIPEKAIIDKLDSSYIIIDHQTAIGKFWALVNWAERDLTEFFALYYMPGKEKGQLVPIQLYHPEYYRSMVVRLYNFDGQAVTPKESIVISYENKVVQGESIKLITNVQTFPSYEKATAFISSQQSGNHRIVGDSPFISPVPLEALKNYKLIYSSKILVAQTGVGGIPAVKIFEYTAQK
jgi:dolichyl-diphosphooligosaccharide--protein glycosyltransferase